MKPYQLAAIIAGALCSHAYANEFKGDNSACWDERRKDMSCTKLTDTLLMSLRFATREQIQKAMNAAGGEIDAARDTPGGGGLHYISNYTRGGSDGTGVVNFIFNKSGKTVIISGFIETANTASSDRFIWNAELLPDGCFDGPNTKMHSCKASF
jgi:hypothetical protein